MVSLPSHDLRNVISFWPKPHKFHRLVVDWASWLNTYQGSTGASQSVCGVEADQRTLHGGALLRRGCWLIERLPQHVVHTAVGPVVVSGSNLQHICMEDILWIISWITPSIKLSSYLCRSWLVAHLQFVLGLVFRAKPQQITVMSVLMFIAGCHRTPTNSPHMRLYSSTLEKGSISVLLWNLGP